MDLFSALPWTSFLHCRGLVSCITRDLLIALLWALALLWSCFLHYHELVLHYCECASCGLISCTTWICSCIAMGLFRDGLVSGTTVTSICQLPWSCPCTTADFLRLHGRVSCPIVDLFLATTMDLFLYHWECASCGLVLCTSWTWSCTTMGLFLALPLTCSCTPVGLFLTLQWSYHALRWTCMTVGCVTLLWRSLNYCALISCTTMDLSLILHRQCSFS